MKEVVAEIFILIISLLVTAMVFFSLGMGKGKDVKRQQIQKQIIENNCGYHDPKTGEFTFGGLK